MNYIIRYKGEGEPNASKLKHDLSSNNIKIVDNSALPQMAKIELDEQDLEKLQAVTKNDWDVFPEKKYAVPTTRRKIKK